MTVYMLTVHLCHCLSEIYLSENQQRQVTMVICRKYCVSCKCIIGFMCKAAGLPPFSYQPVPSFTSQAITENMICLHRHH